MNYWKFLSLTDTYAINNTPMTLHTFRENTDGPNQKYYTDEIIQPVSINSDIIHSNELYNKYNTYRMINQ